MHKKCIVNSESAIFRQRHWTFQKSGNFKNTMRCIFTRDHCVQKIMHGIGCVEENNEDKEDKEDVSLYVSNINIFSVKEGRSHNRFGALKR